MGQSKRNVKERNIDVSKSKTFFNSRNPFFYAKCVFSELVQKWHSHRKQKVITQDMAEVNHLHQYYPKENHQSRFTELGKA